MADSGMTYEYPAEAVLQRAAESRAKDTEIVRLRALVESAYREGFADGSAGGSGGMDRNWKRSEAQAALSNPTRCDERTP